MLHTLDWMLFGVSGVNQKGWSEESERPVNVRLGDLLSVELSCDSFRFKGLSAARVRPFSWHFSVLAIGGGGGLKITEYLY